ncbi:MAG: hypothetical protein AB7S38_11260 [Vulcanimicrobiota bacterium]
MRALCANGGYPANAHHQNVRRGVNQQQPLGDRVTFSSLTKAEQDSAVQKLIELDSKGRLFLANQDGKLRRVGPEEAASALDSGPTVFLAREVAELGRNQSSSGTWNKRGWSGPVLYSESGAAAGSYASRTVNFATSQLNSWPQLRFVNAATNGVPGTPELPGPAGSVKVSESWESWRSVQTQGVRIGHWGGLAVGDGSSHQTELDSGFLSPRG